MGSLEEMRPEFSSVGRVRAIPRVNSVLGREVNLLMKDSYKLFCCDLHMKFGDSPINND